MSGKPDIRGYVNPNTPGETEAGQRDGMTVGAEIYVENREGIVADRMIRSIRAGAIVEVKELHCLAPAEGRPRKRRRLLAERIEAIKKLGGTIREWSTGYVSKGRLPTMMNHAHEQIASSGRARKNISRGRPPKWELTPHEITIIEGIWGSRRYKNDNERLIAIEKNTGKRISRQWLRLRLGSPHKPVDPTTLPQRVALAAERKRHRIDYVYFILDGRKVKIGHSVEPQSVIKSLRRGNHRNLILLGVMPGGQPREARLHQKFDKDRRNGEWFSFSPEIQTYVAKYAKKSPK